MTDIVERVARAIWVLHEGTGLWPFKSPKHLYGAAQAALEASGHDELVEALRVVAQGLTDGQIKRRKLAEQVLAKYGDGK